MTIGKSLALFALAPAVSIGAQQTVSAPPGLAQRPAEQKAQIALSVVVTDKSGHPIPGLTQSDFTLLDNGQAAALASFAAIATSAAAAAAPAPAATDASGAPPAQVVLVIDELNTPFVAVSTERIQLHEFLTKNQGHLALPVSIFVVADNGAKRLNQPTADGNALDARLRQEQGALRDIPRSAGFYGGTDRLQISLQSLGQITSELARIPGRKLLVWISQGWWIFNSPNVIISDPQRRAFFGAVVNFSSLLVQGQITLDSIDPQGTEDASNFRNFAWQDFLKPVTVPKKGDPGDVALQVLATHSGGQVLFGSNDIASEVNRCVSDGTVWYRLTFAPQNSEGPDTWHSLTVKVDKPGAKVRTEYGYYAQP